MISRRVMNIGTIHAAEVRTFSVQVEVSSHDKPPSEL